MDRRERAIGVEPEACPTCGGDGGNLVGTLCATCSGSGKAPPNPEAPLTEEDAATLLWDLLNGRAQSLYERPEVRRLGPGLLRLELGGVAFRIAVDREPR